MEEFILEIENNMKDHTKLSQQSQQDLRFRTMISNVIDTIPNILITDTVNSDGDVSFSVTIDELGLSFDLFLKYKDEIFSDYMANTLGELLVRENIGKFRLLLTSINVDEYHTMISHYEHRQFGMEIIRNKFVFTFHISLLQSILTENFRKKIK